MIRALLLALLLLVPAAARGQNYGNVKPMTVLGNPDPGNSKPLVPTPLSAMMPIGNTTDWIGTYAYGCTASSAAVCAQSQFGGPGITGASRNTDNIGVPSASIGVIGWNFNFNTNPAQAAGGWGIYGEARRITGAGTAFAAELDATQFGTPIDLNPYNFTASGVVASAWLASGGDCKTATPCYTPGGNLPANPASAAIGILDNGAKFRAGITVRASALDTTMTTMSTGGRFAFLPAGASIDWWSNATTPIGALSADITTDANPSLLWVGANPIFALVGTEANNHIYAMREGAGVFWFQDRTANNPTWNFENSAGGTLFQINSAGTTVTGFLKVFAVAAPGGSGGRYICVGEDGTFYQKVSCP